MSLDEAGQEHAAFGRDFPHAGAGQLRVILKPSRLMDAPNAA